MQRARKGPLHFLWMGMLSSLRTWGSDMRNVPVAPETGVLGGRRTGSEPSCPSAAPKTRLL